MRTVAICHQENATTIEGAAQIEIDGVPVTCGIVRTRPPEAAGGGAAPADHALVRIRAFSCNYRDKRLILRMAVRGTPGTFYVIGSEFTGEVLAVGPGVRHLAPGDRVIGNGSYPVADAPGAQPGLPTNHGSRELQVLHAAKLMAIPASMPDEVAAAFPIGAQTTYSMIRRLDLAPGARVLVTAARSNTSLFALAALGPLDVTTFALTTSPGWEARLREAGADHVLTVPPDADRLTQCEAVSRVLGEGGGFDAVIDPFFDLYLPRVVEVMNVGARYVTCGLYAQSLDLTGERLAHRGLGAIELLTTVMLRNLTIIGNCIGLTSDLQRAIDDYAAGRLPVLVDSVYGGVDVGSFLDRTYNARDRFGKVVYRY